MKYILHILFYSAVIWLNGCAANEMSEAEIITACQQTIFGYAHSRDAVDLDENAALFTVDATLRIRDTILSGQSEIKAGLADRGPKQSTRHVITSVNIDIDDDKNIGAESYALLYSGPPKLQNAGSSAPLALKYILTYKDELQHDGADCLIKNRHVIIETVVN